MDEAVKTIHEQIASVRREIGKRQHVYKRLVSAGKMTQKKADYEVECMESVLHTLEQVKRKAEPELF